MADEPMAAPAPEPAPAHAGFDAPMRVDWLDAAELGGTSRGRLGLTFLPGKHGASMRYPGHAYRRSVAEDLASLYRQGVRTLVLLVEDAELQRWGDPAIVALGEQAGIAVRRFPIPDGHTTSVGTMGRIIRTVDEGRRGGDVAVACLGGVGRTGMVAACALVSAGLSAPDAIARVREVRHPEAVEMREQELLVADWERHLNTASD
jgi:protein-tyrosine phosphatase